MHELLHEVPADDSIYPAGSVLITKGERPSRLIQLVEGQVEILTRHGDRTRLNAPSLIGEISYLGRVEAVADVVSLTDVRARVIYDDVLQAWGKQYPEKMMALHAELARIAIARLSGNFHERYCAVVAHDGRKSELLTFINAHRSYFSSRALLATATTGARIEQELGIPVARRVLSGPVGGDQEIGALVSRGFVEAVFFYRDPLWAQPHQADVNALVRVCELANVPLATNDATARLIIAGLMSKVAPE